MAKFSAARGFTLLEMLAAVCIVLILVATLYPALEQITPRAEKISCINNLKNLHTLFAATYAVDGWPQVPSGIALGSIEEQKWWLDKSKKELGLSEKNWECPTLRRRFRSVKESERQAIHYLPTPFSKQPNRANQWPQMPWFIEISDAHGGGNLLILQTGTVEQSQR